MKKNKFKQLLFIGLSMFICANAQGQTTELRSMIESDNASINCLSENGEWACGSAFNNADGAGNQMNASKWNLTTGERTYLVPEDEIDGAQSDAFCISNDGTLVGGQYLYQPAYNLNGEWHTLSLPNRYLMGEVRDLAIIGTDTIFVGRAFDGDGFQKVQAVKWVNGVLTTAIDLIPEDFLYDEEGKMMNQLTDISTDGKIMLGAIKPLYWPQDPNIEQRVPFIIKDGEFKLLSPKNREEFSKFNKNDVCFFQEEKLSHNGKFIALQLFANQMNISCYYDVEKDKFILIEEAPANTKCLVVDNEGNPYYGGPVLTGDFRNTYVSINGKATLIEDVLKANFGVTQEQIDATCPYDDLLKGSLRWIYDISADAKTIIGCAGEGRGTYNWVLKLPYPLTSKTLPSAIENTINNNLAALYNNGNISFTDIVNHVEIYNINGQLIQKQDVEGNTVKVNFEQGIYVVKMYNTQDNNITTCKLIIK